MIQRLALLVLLLSTWGFSAVAQTSMYPDTLRKDRIRGVAIGVGSAYAGSMTGLYALWYKDYEQSKFQYFNDNNEWLQIDKIGHAQTAYTTGWYGYEALRWTGLSEKKSVLYGASMGWVFLATIEMMDAFSAKWGFSWGDMAANTAGTALFMGQQLAWGEQRILMKFSYHPTEFAQYRPDALGSTWSERLLKDYNGQTYWLSTRLGAFKGLEKIPSWLCVSVGYGATGMLGGPSNPSEVGGVPVPQFDRYRQYYLSLDVDLTQIKTRSRLLKTILVAANFIKIPAPTLSVDQKGVWRLYPVYF